MTPSASAQITAAYVAAICCISAATLLAGGAWLVSPVPLVIGLGLVLKARNH